MDVQAPTKSLSVSLSQTRSLISELSEFLNQPKTSVKAKGKTTKARVLTSAESLSLLIEKEKKKKEEEEAKAKRKEERERKRKEKEAEKQRKAEMKKSKEKAAKKPSKSKQSNKKTAVPSDPPPSDSESQGSGDEDGIQSHEISNNECAICFGLCQDDLSSTGKLLTEWVECTNTTCKKWMHIQCLQLKDGLYVCGLCGAHFS